jgi:cytochrome c oxidase subunit IV
MATTHGSTEVVGHDGDDHGAHSNITYVWIAVILAVLTALEVVAYETSGDLRNTAAFVIGLCVVMVIKFVLVASYFMHLKYDSKLLTYAFYSGLVLAIAVYITILAAFRFFWPASQMISS